MPAISQNHLIEYLQTELALPAGAIELSMRQQSITGGPLQIILWQHGLITIEQMAQIFDWLEASTPVLTP